MKIAEVGFITAANTGLTDDDALAVRELQRLNVQVRLQVWDDTSPEGLAGMPQIIRSPWDYHEKRAAFRAWLERCRELQLPLHNSPEVALWNLDKVYLAEIASARVPIPRTLWLEPGVPGDLAGIMDRTGLPELVVKPTISASGADTFRVTRDNLEEGQSRLEALGSRRVMVQEFLPEILEGGELSFLFFDRKFSHAVRKLPRDGEFRVQEEHGATHSALEPSASTVELAASVLSSIGVPLLYARVDLVERGGKFLLMELEVIEPSLYLRHDVEAPKRFARAVRDRIDAFRN